MQQLSCSHELPYEDGQDIAYILDYEDKIIEYIKTSKIQYLYKQIVQKIFNQNEVLTEDKIDLLIEHLVLQGYIYRVNNAILRVCPSCKSNISTLECSQCGSHDIVVNKKILHKCGYMDNISAFLQGEQFMCPSCKEEIDFNGEDYRFSDTEYYCLDCDMVTSKYAKLDDIVFCEKCGQSHPKHELQFVHPYKIIKIQ